MGPRTLRFPLLCTLLGAASLAAQAQVFVVGVKTAEADAVTEFKPTHVELPADPLDQRGRLGLIRDLESEQGFAHRELPLGAGLELVANGNMTPRDDTYKQMLYQKGQSAGPGDRVQITALKFEGNKLLIDFNGGPYAKHRFLSHISLDDMQLAQEGPIATGCRITLIFEGGIPNVTAAEVKALLDPMVDFHAKSSAEAYADTLQPKVRLAVESHQILVGMNRRMVLASLGEPRSKHREQVTPGDENSPFWEEWIYGEAPDATQFVRFREGRVVRLEIAAIGKPVEIRDKPEIGPEQAPTLQARTVMNGDDQPDPDGERQHRPPSLMKPGEKNPDSANTVGKVKLPDDTPPANQPQHLRASLE
jgi:hypothetical protein